jgi:hypothetical protein
LVSVAALLMLGSLAQASTAGHFLRSAAPAAEADADATGSLRKQGASPSDATALAKKRATDESDITGSIKRRAPIRH